MERICAVCGEEIMKLDNLAEWKIDVYRGSVKKYCFHRACLSQVSIEGLN